jgi:hypothetical protein
MQTEGMWTRLSPVCRHGEPKEVPRSSISQLFFSFFFGVRVLFCRVMTCGFLSWKLNFTCISRRFKTRFWGPHNVWSCFYKIPNVYDHGDTNGFVQVVPWVFFPVFLYGGFTLFLYWAFTRFSCLSPHGWKDFSVFPFS